MDALDAYIELPAREVDKPFLLAIEGVCSIEGASGDSAPDDGEAARLEE